jgi:hypothetical protein
MPIIIWKYTLFSIFSPTENGMFNFYGECYMISFFDLCCFPLFRCSQWIYQNVWSKWDNIVKRPQKLIDMFTGYHANKATIYAALRNAGISERYVGFFSITLFHDFYRWKPQLMFFQCICCGAKSKLSWPVTSSEIHDRLQVFVTHVYILLKMVQFLFHIILLSNGNSYILKCHSKSWIFSPQALDILNIPTSY